MESFVDGMAQQAEDIAQQARESKTIMFDNFVTLDSKMGKLANAQEQQPKVYTAHTLEQEIRQEFSQHIEEEYQKELTVFAQRSEDKNMTGISNAHSNNGATTGCKVTEVNCAKIDKKDTQWHAQPAEISAENTDWKREALHNRRVQSMKRNLSRETRRADDSLTALHHSKETMESKPGEILVKQNEIQWSTALKGEMHSRHGEMLVLQAKLQGAKTALFNFHIEKFEEQQKELDSYKTKREEYKDEKVNLKRQMQEMRASCGTGLLDVKNSTRCLQLSSDFHTSAKRQQQPHTGQSMQHRQNSSWNEEDREQQQYVKTLHQQLPPSPVSYKTNTLQPCLRKLFLQKTYWKGVVVVWGFVRCNCACANFLCWKSFEREGGCYMFFVLNNSQQQQQPVGVSSRSQREDGSDGSEVKRDSTTDRVEGGIVA